VPWSPAIRKQNVQRKTLPEDTQDGKLLSIQLRHDAAGPPVALDHIVNAKDTVGRSEVEGSAKDALGETGVRLHAYG